MKKEREILKTSTVNENSLNFELAKMKHKIKANYLNTTKTNLYIFTKECCATA